MLMDYQTKSLVDKNPSPYYNPIQNRLNSLQRYMDNNLRVSGNYDPTDVTVEPKYDYGLQALKLGSDTAQLNTSSAINAANNAAAQAAANNASMFNQQNNAGGAPDLRAVLRALGAQESGNSYSAVNKDSGALGRWQVMPSNIPQWSQEALGRQINEQQFLNHPRLQNQIVRNQFGDLLSKYGIKGALSAWYSGSPTRWNEKSPQGDYPSVHDYVLEVLKRLGMI